MLDSIATTEQAKPTIDLQPFCADEDEHLNKRYVLPHPWFYNGYIYASDARIMIRVPATDAIQVKPFPEEFLPAQSVEMFEKPLKREPQEWPQQNYLRCMQPCPQCSGHGKIECECCEEWSCACLYCNGRKRFEQDYGIRIGNHTIGPKYDQLIRALPNPRWITEANHEKPLPFVFDGGEGRVMGLRPITPN